jgi:hypothetical protein
MSRPLRLLPVALGILAAVTLLAVLSMSDDSAVDVVCNIGSDQDQPAYERCIVELPALQAHRDEEVRAGAVTRPVVALAGGIIVALAAHLIVRPRTPKHSPADDDQLTLRRGAGTG